MDSYKTDDEQIEALRTWWKENGKSTVLGVVLALGGFFGWQAWQDSRTASAEDASNLYQGMLEADVQATENAEQKATARRLAQSLKKDFSNTAYANFAGLYLAKYAAQEGDWAAAEQELKAVLGNNPEKHIAIQAKIGLAQVALAKEQYTQALTKLKIAEPLAYKPLIEELRGDIYYAQQNYSAALSAYESAAAAREDLEQPVPNPMLDNKIQELRSRTAAVGDPS